MFLWVENTLPNEKNMLFRFYYALFRSNQKIPSNHKNETICIVHDYLQRKLNLKTLNQWG